MNKEMQVKCEQVFLEKPWSSHTWWLVYTFGLVLIPVRLIVLFSSVAMYCLVAKIIYPFSSKPDTTTLRYKIYTFFLRWAFTIEGWCTGLLAVTVKGKPDPAAPICVANHIAWLEIMYLFARGYGFISKDFVGDIPFISNLANINGTLYIPSKKNAKSSDDSFVDTMKKRIAAFKEQNMPPLMVFPEGTTTAGRGLIRFRTGAFVAGEPVQPILVRYPYSYFDPSWSVGSIKKYLCALMAQIYTRVDIEFCETYYPSAAEIKNPRLYADNVGKLMAKKLGVTYHIDVTYAEKQQYEDFLAKKG
eukprot:TRINITY_DN12994_c0_g1_i1.p1 TRINITY_DN12994_c0_g1~~TRINITY_DN12994_c0_g1_i1.p1  ORF type:complete len:303 (-),score=41.44 TRINITY_DN12994_c0_g1_i1:44-952(-)